MTLPAASAATRRSPGICFRSAVDNPILTSSSLQQAPLRTDLQRHKLRGCRLRASADGDGFSRITNQLEWERMGSEASRRLYISLSGILLRKKTHRWGIDRVPRCNRSTGEDGASEAKESKANHLTGRALY